MDQGAVDQAVSIVRRRSNRAIATVLGVKERECDSYLPHAISEKLRKTVLDQINELADLAVDCIRSAARDGLHNDLYMEELEVIHQKVDLMIASLDE